MIHCALLVGSPAQDPASLLHPKEVGLLGPRAVAKRRDDFARGRHIARRLLGHLLGGDRDRFAVLPDDRGVPVAYEADGVAVPLSLSISHTKGLAAACCAPPPLLAGIDVERYIESPDRIIDEYFIGQEQDWVYALGAQEACRRAAAIWSLKESVLKCLGEGLRLSPKSFTCRVEEGNAAWQSVSFDLSKCKEAVGLIARGWVRNLPAAVVSVAVTAPHAADDLLPCEPTVCFEIVAT